MLALLQRRVFAGDVPEPLFQHFGVHARCLIAIPLLVVAEAVKVHGIRHPVPGHGAADVRRLIREALTRR